MTDAALAARCRLQEAPIDVTAVVGMVGGSFAGAVVTFLGTVRDQTGGRRVVGLEYEAYRSMAEKQFARFVGEVEARWEGVRAAIVHRVGHLEVGACSVAIAVASAHRAAGFEACRHLIERLKVDAPIWKREVYADGAAWVGWGS